MSQRTYPGLTELQTSRGHSWVTDDNRIAVRRRLQGCETASNDEGADEEAAEACERVVGRGIVRNRPEEDRAGRVEGQAHQDGDLVAYQDSQNELLMILSVFTVPLRRRTSAAMGEKQK